MSLTGGPPPPPRAPGAPPVQPPRPTQLITGADGGYAFRNLARGTYVVGAAKTGYISGGYGKLRPEGVGHTITVDEGERRVDATIRLFRYATIAGTVVDESGEPFVGVRVVATRRTLTGGRRVLGPRAVSWQTDDRGMYRIGGLTPGEYVVWITTVQSTMPARPGAAGAFVAADRRFLLAAGPLGGLPDATGRVIGYAQAYYQSSPTASQATPIVVGSGEERLGVDFALRPVPTSNISGHITVTEGAMDRYVLRLTPTETGGATGDLDVGVATADAAGAFMFMAIPAGRYVLSTTQTIRTAPGMAGGQAGVAPQPPVSILGTTYWASMSVVAGDQDISDLTVAIQPGLIVSGRVEFEGVVPAGRAIGGTAQIDSVEGPVRLSASATLLGPLSQFTTSGLVPGKYAMSVSPFGDWTLKSVVTGGIDVTDTSFELTDRDVTDMVITFTDRVSTIGGTVRGPQGSPDGAASVVIFPIDARLWQDYGLSPRRLKRARALPTGAFTPVGVPPGEYLVVAISDELADEWQDPRFLEVLARQATRVSLGEGQKATVELRRVVVVETGELGNWRTGELKSGEPKTGELKIVDQYSGSSYLAYPAYLAYLAYPAYPAYQVPNRDTRIAPPAGTGVVSGVVLAADGSERPIGRASVLVRDPDLRTDYATRSDEAGRFVLRNIPPGRYTVMVSKPTYLSAYYGTGQGVLPPGLPIAVTAEKPVSGLSLRMVRGAVISGTVVDEFGGPVAAARLQVLQTVGTGTERRFVGAPTQGVLTTDDRGGYRVFGLQPGSYIVGVAPLPGASQQQEVRLATNPVRAVGYAPYFYPGAQSPAEATLVTVAAGQEATGIDIPMRLVPTARVDGTVVGADGQPVANTQVQFASGAQLQLPMAQASIVSATPDGRFSAVGLLPGRYLIAARAVDRAAAEAKPRTPGQMLPILWAQQEVDIRGEDISGIALVLQPALTASGRVIFEGTKPEALSDIKDLRIIVTGGSLLLAPGSPPIPLDDEGRFVATNLVPGQYKVTASALSILGNGAAGIWSLASIMSGGKDLLDYPLELRPGQHVTDIVFTYASQTSELSGRLLDASGKPIVDLSLLLFTTDRALWSPQSRRVRPPIRPADDGTFRFVNLPPGEYFLGVTSDIDLREAGDPAFLDRLAPSAIRLTIAPGEKKVQDLKIAGRPLSAGPAARSATRRPPGR